MQIGNSISIQSFKPLAITVVSLGIPAALAVLFGVLGAHGMLGGQCQSLINKSIVPFFNTQLDTPFGGHFPVWGFVPLELFGIAALIYVIADSRFDKKNPDTHSELDQKKKGLGNFPVSPTK
jgi:hypothetical protein